MEGRSLFDEPYYISINHARWAAAEQVLAALQDEAGLSLTTCLDVGCGPGWFSQRLAHRGLAVEGLDGRPANVELARQRLPGCRFHLANIESEGTVNGLGPYDLVFCFGLLYHTENPFRVIRNLRRVTRRVLFLESIIVPLESPCAWLVEESQNETQGLTSFALVPSHTCLTKMLQAAGFVHVYDCAVPVSHEDFAESATRHRRRRLFVASPAPLCAPDLVAVPPVTTPKFDFTKRAG